jgi:hypothetical protein
VLGVLNPADLNSRGYLPKQLLNSCWWNGPESLRIAGLVGVGRMKKKQ